MVVVSRRHFQSLRLELKLKLSGLGLRRSLMFSRAQSPSSALHYSLLLANRVLLLGMRVHLVVLMLKWLHLGMLLVLRMGIHFCMLLMWLMGVHFVVLRVLSMGVHLVMLLMGL